MASRARLTASKSNSRSRGVQHPTAFTWQPGLSQLPCRIGSVAGVNVQTMSASRTAAAAFAHTVTGGGLPGLAAISSASCRTFSGLRPHTITRLTVGPCRHAPG